MTIKALAIAATGMNAQETNLEVVANNIANINTTGFKRARAEFTDLLYQNVQSQGIARQAGLDLVPEGAKLGLGVKLAAIRDVHIQGSLNETGNSLLTSRSMVVGFFNSQGLTGENRIHACWCSEPQSGRSDCKSERLSA